MWTVVHFETDNTVDVVPDFWYKNGLCDWPNKTNRMDTTTTIKRRVKPDEIHFKKYKARTLLTNIASFQEAQSKVTKAQETSDLSSANDNDNKATKTVKRIKNSIPAEISKLPNPPKYFEESENESTADDSDKDKTYTPPSILDTLSHDSDQSIENEPEIISNGELVLKATTENSGFSGSSQKRIKMSYTNSLLTQENHIPEHGLFISPSATTNATTKENETDQSFKKFIKRSLTTLKYDVENIHKRMDVLESLLEKIDDKFTGKSNVFSETFATHEDIITLIENDTDLNQMEDRLINDSLYRTAVVKTLSRFLSNSLPETIRKMMQKLFSDSFLMNYSYIGFKGKNQFSTLQSCSIIFEAVRLTKKFSDIPNIEVEKPIKNWMAQASQREKLKKQKNDKNEHAIN